MKLIIHAAIFTAGTVEYDSDTGEYRLLVDPLINADQGLSGSEAFSPEEATKHGQLALALLNNATAKWVLKQMGIDAKVVTPGKPIPLVNVVGGKGKASA